MCEATNVVEGGKVTTQSTTVTLHVLRKSYKTMSDVTISTIVFSFLKLNQNLLGGACI